MDTDDPRHGSYAGVAQHERDNEPPCPPCLNARRAYGRTRPHMKTLGRPLRGPIGHLAHTNTIALADLTDSEWHRATGLSATARKNAMTGPQANARLRVRQDLERLDVGGILAKRLTHQGAQRRVRALTAVGYTTAQLSDATGICKDSIVKLRDTAIWSSLTTRRKVAAAYDQLAHTTQPRNKISARFYNLATAENWAPPLAWDNIDDPNETPDGYSTTIRYHDSVDENVIQRVLNGEKLRTTRAEKEEIMRRWTATGSSARSLENRMGWKQGRYKAPAREAS